MKLSRLVSALLFALLPALVGQAASTPPTITAHPASATAPVGAPANFSVTATPTATATYQWRRSGYPIPGATSATLSFPGLKRSDADFYDVVVTNDLSSSTSARAQLSVTPTAFPDALQLDPGAASDFAMESDVLGSINASSAYPGGKYIIAGDWVRTAGNASHRRIARIDSTGAVDTTFTANVSGVINAVSVDEVSGKILIGGAFYLVNGVQRPYLARLNADGSLDTTFNPTGAGPSSPVNTIVRDTDGSYLVGGTFTSYNGAVVNRIVRIDATGARDFYWPTGTGTGVNGTVTSIAIDRAASGVATGRFVVGGMFTAVSNGTGGTLNRIARFKADGTLDTTFVIGTGFNNNVNTVAFEPTSSDFVVGGAFTFYNGVQIPRLLRLKSNGTIDAAFSDIGGAGYTSGTTVTLTGPGGSGAAATPIVDSSTGRITGFTITDGGSGYTAAPVVSFIGPATVLASASTTITNGVVTGITLFTLKGPNDTVNTVVYDTANSRWLVGGAFTGIGFGTGRNRIAALDASGNPDPTFNPSLSGAVFTILPLGGKTLVGGNFNSVAGQPYRLLTRVSATTGVADAEVAVNFRAAGVVSRVLPLANGKLLLAGTFNYLGGTPSSNLAVLNADLSLATAFPPGSGPNGAVLAAAMQGDGKIVLAGQFTQFAGTSANRVVRLHGDLSHDNAFTADAALNNGSVNAIALMPGGGLYAGGSFTAGSRASLVQLTSTGAISSGFTASTTQFAINALLLLPSGQLVAGGSFSTVNSQSRGNLAVFGGDGSLSTLIPAAGVNGTVRALGWVPDPVQPNGKILVGGDFTTYNNGTANRLARINTSDGALDTSFAVGTTFNNQVYNFTHDIGSGDTLVWGSFVTNPADGLASAGFARVRSNGALDASAFIPQIQNVFLSQPSAFYVRDDGSLLVGGSSFTLDFKERTGLALFTAATAPTITTEPTDQVAAIGGNVTFTVAATGSGQLSYQWHRNGVRIPGATSPQYSLTNITLADVGGYTAVVRNAYGDAVSDTVRLTGANPPPAIADLPGLLTPVAGTNATLTATATGSGPLSYQWFRNGAALAGATQATLTLNNVGLANDGRYTVRVNTGLSVNCSETSTEVKVRPATYPGALQASTAFNAKIEAQGNVTSLVTLSDGKFYGAGTFNTVNGVTRYTLARFNVDGSLDSTFAPAVISGGNTTAVVVQTDGKILIGGGFLTIGGVSRPYLARLNADGTLDSEFLPGGGGPDTTVTALAIGDNNKIFVGGYFESFSGIPVSRLARLNTDGTLDPTFIVGAGFNSGSNVNKIVPVSGGKVLVGGSFTSYRGADALGIIRLAADGSRDGTFASADAFKSAANAPDTTPGIVFTFAVQTDGRIVVGGSFIRHGSTTVNRIARLNTDGTLDTAGFTVGTGFNAGSVTAIALQANGAIVAGGSFASYNGKNASRIARLSSAGVLDEAFTVSGGNGFPTNGGNVASLAIQTINTVETILVGGGFSIHNGMARGGLIRLTNSGAVSPNFSAAVRSGGTVFALLPLANDKWLVAGSFTYVNNQPATNIARLTATGDFDAGFAPGLAGFNGLVSTVVPQPDGRFIVGGNFTQYNGVTANRIARLNADGTLDTTFAPGAAFNGAVNAIVQLADGSLVVGGAFTTYAGEGRNRIVRLDANGAIDFSFSIGDGFNGPVTALALTPDDHVLVGGNGFTEFDGSPRKNIARLTWDGEVDATFIPPADFNATTINTIAGLPDGSVLASGSFAVTSEYSSDTQQTSHRTNSVVKLSPTGALDTAFAPAVGRSFSTLPNSTRASFAVQADGKIVVMGSFVGYDGVARVGLARLESNGSLDQSFGAPLIGVGHSSISNNPIVYGANGRLYVSGLYFNLPGGVPTGLVAFDAGPSARAILRQPAAQRTVVGGSAVFSVVATGSGAVTYQWRRGTTNLVDDGLHITGAQSSRLILAGVRNSDPGDYSVVVTDATGFTASAAATLTVSLSPWDIAVVTPPPAAVSAPAGETLTLSIDAAASVGTLTYQWRKFGVALAGQTNATLDLGTAGLDAAGYYDVVVSNGITTRTTPVTQVSIAASAQPGTLVPRAAFAPRVEMPGTITAFAPLAEGKFYAAGSFTKVDGATHYGIARFLADGTVDPTFTAPLITGVINHIAVQGSKVVLGGAFTYVGNRNSFRLGRLNENGTVDPTFEIGSGVSGGVVNAIAVQGDNKILIAGALTGLDGVFANRILRLDVNGAPDAAFAAALGGGFDGAINALVLQGDKIVVGGAFNTLAGQPAARIARLTSSGARDPDFIPSGFDGTVNALALQGTQIVVGGQFTGGLARLNNTGSRDGSIPLTGGFTGGAVSAVAIDGSYIVVGGAFTSYNGSTANRLARIGSSTGIRDTIGLGGSSGVNNTVRALALDSTGKLLVGGAFGFVGNSARSGFARFNADGTLDTPAPAVREPGQIFAVQPVSGDRFVIGGSFTHVGGNARSNLALVDATGAPDTSFAIGSGPNGIVRAIVQQGDGKLVIGGGFTSFNGVLSVNRIARLSLDGTRDTDFTTQVGTGFGNNQVFALALAPDGAIAVGGSFTSVNGVATNRIARLLPTGAVDTAFTTANGTAFDNTVNALLVQRDGKIVAGGLFTGFNNAQTLPGGAPNPDFGRLSRGVVRLGADGGLDPGFLNGVGVTPTATGAFSVAALLLQPDDRIVVAGSFTGFGASTATNIARLNADGTADTSFAVGTGLNSNVQALALQSDGKIVVAGNFSFVHGQRRAGFARLTTTGALDPTFGVPFGSGVPSTQVNVLRQLGDGSFLLGQTGRQDFFTSLAGPLTILEDGPALAVLAPPFGGTLTAGSTTAVLTVTAAGDGLTYTWTRNGAPLEDNAADVIGTKTNTLVFRNVQTAPDAGTYSVTVTDASNNTVTTAPVTIAVRASAPSASTPVYGSFGPVLQAGSAAYVAVNATGSQPMTVTWTRDGTPLTGGFYDSGVFYQPITPVKPGDAGVYAVTLTNAQGSATPAPTRIWVSEETGWSAHNPKPTPQALAQVVALGDQTLALGTLGARVSLQGSAAAQLPALAQNTLIDYLQGNGLHLLVGQNGQFGVSSDGSIWSSATLPSLESTQGAVFGAGLFVVTTHYAGSASGRSKIFTSHDGKTWIERYSSASLALANVTYGNGYFLAASDAGLLRSTDGTNWSLQSGSPTHAISVSHVAGQFFVLGTDNLLHVSSDATTWTSRSYGATGGRFIGHGDNQYVLTGDLGLILTSPDAVTWTRRTSGTILPLRAASYTGGSWTVVSNLTAPVAILTSTDSGATWTNRATAVTQQNLHSLATNGTSHLIAVGPGGTILRTTDGATWTQVSSGVSVELEGAVYGAGKYIVTGANGRILTSSDGTMWTVATAGADYLSGAVFFNNQFLVTGNNGRILKSPDGSTWTTATVFSSNPMGNEDGGQVRDLAYGAGLYLAVSQDGRVASSVDAATWVSVDTGVTAEAFGVAYGNGKFLLPTSAGILSSINGTAWTLSPAPVIPDWDSGTLFIGGQFYAGAGLNSFITSPDGLTWTGHHLGTTYGDINDLAVFNGRLYLSGERGMILSAPLAPAIAQQPLAPAYALGQPATFRVIATGSPETVTYQWRRNGDVIAGATSSTYTISSATADQQGFYDVLVRNSSGVITSSQVTFGTPPPAGPERLLHVQARVTVGTGENALLASFTIDGTGAKTVLVRAAGPALLNFGVFDALADPRLAIYDAEGTLVASNDDWSGVESMVSQVGAFPFTSGSKDAALAVALEAGTYTARVTGANSTSGVALIEVYDTSGTGQRFDYVSTRARAGQGADTLVAGIRVGGTLPQTVLIRALGESLVPGMGALADVTLRIFDGNNVEVASNDNWGTNGNLSALAKETAAAGAMPLATSDAALLLTLNPGSYTVHVTGAGGATGFALVEAHLIDANRAAQFAPAIIAPVLGKSLFSNNPLYLNAPIVAKPGTVSYQWKKDGVNVQGTPVAGAPGAYFVPSATEADSGLYTVTITNGAGTIVSAPAQVTVTAPSGYGATQSLVGAGYLRGQTFTVVVALEHPLTSGSLQWAVTLPALWSFVSEEGSGATTKPAAGATRTIVWTWTTPPASPLVFSYKVNVPLDEASERQILGRLTATSTPGTPSANAPALVVRPQVALHSADTNSDLRLSLGELTRVISLYNTYVGTTHTGRYKVQGGTEDGFAQDFSAGGSALAKYHSADSDRDGAISMEELTRVIELYNVRQGTVRTGAYRTSTDTEDGFDLASP